MKFTKSEIITKNIDDLIEEINDLSNPTDIKINLAGEFEDGKYIYSFDFGYNRIMGDGEYRLEVGFEFNPINCDDIFPKRFRYFRNFTEEEALEYVDLKDENIAHNANSGVDEAIRAQFTNFIKNGVHSTLKAYELTILDRRICIVTDNSDNVFTKATTIYPNLFSNNQLTFVTRPDRVGIYSDISLNNLFNILDKMNREVKYGKRLSANIPD